MEDANVIYRLLGELEVSNGGQLAELPVGPALIVLAALLMNANRQLAKTDLIRAAWAGDEASEAQLHKRVKQVRDLLAKIGRSGDIRTHPRFGYELHVAAGEVDALLFRQLVREADEAAAQRRGEDEIGYLRRALRLWRGPHPLANVPGEVFRQDAIALEQRHRRAATRLFELELAAGRHEQVLDELILVAGYYPSDRRLCEQLMIAQYRCGQVIDAMNAFERYRDAVSEETGGPPDPLLRTLHFAIARGDTDEIAATEDALAKRAGRSALQLVTVPRQLPSPVELVGREDLVAETSWLLQRDRRGAPAQVVVISGPGGMGKTALAVRAAHDSRESYPDGQLFMELTGPTGGLADTGEVLAQFLRALGAPRVPETLPERLAEYRTQLSGRRVLIVLDDASDGAQVSDLVPGTEGCAVLVTARQRLPEVSGSHHVAPLGPLEPAAATELFLRVLRESGISVPDDDEAIGRVVALCGGLPLALRIAAAMRVHDHPRPTAELAARLATYGPDAFAHGRLSVSRTIGAGFDRLGEPARRLFLGFGLLPLGDFGLWTAAAILSESDLQRLAGGSGGSGRSRPLHPPPATRVSTAGAGLAELAASFMIESDHVAMRYRFHDLTREYARQRAIAEYPGDQAAVPARAYRALLTLARRAHSRLIGGEFEVVHCDIEDWAAPAEALAEIDASPIGWFEKERSNLRAAVEHCAMLGLTEICWDLAVSAHEFYGIGEYYDDWYTTHAVALDACVQAGDQLGVGIVLACRNQPALVASRWANGASALAELERSVSLLTEVGNRHGQAIALRTLANALRRQGHLSRPLAMFTESLAHYEASRDTVGRCQALRFIGQTHFDAGRYAQARRVLRAAAAVAGELGNERVLAQTRYWIGQTCLAAGDLQGAQAAFDAVFVTYFSESGVGHAYAMHGLGDVARYTGGYPMAARHLAGAAGLARDGGDSVLEGRVWLSVAGLARERGRPDDEGEALRQAVTLFAGCGAVYLEIRALSELAQALTRRGEQTVAREAWDLVEDRYRIGGVPPEDRLYGRDDF
jgi:DNA-binding SARP family transcriptional activator/tetratricopeptide (TPR) repeat protein